MEMPLKLKPLTWGLLGAALLLGGGVAVWEMRQPPAQNQVENNPDQRQFTFTTDMAQAIGIRQRDQYLKLYRSAGKDPVWKMDWPQPMEVSVPAVDFLLNALMTSKTDRDFDVDVQKLAEYGLAEPTAILTIQLVTGKTHELRLGNPDFKGDAVYALIDPADPPTDTVRIHLLPRSLIELARRSPQEWQQASLNSSETTDDAANTTAPSPNPPPSPMP